MSDCSTHVFDVPLKPCPNCGAKVMSEYPKNRKDKK